MALICPNCGRKQVFQDDGKRGKFTCPHCQFKVPDIKLKSPSFLKRNPNIVFEIFFIFIGIISAAVGLKGFLIPNGLIDGGVTGISMLCSRVFGLDLGYFIFFINVPFIVVAYNFFNKEFAIRAALTIVFLALFLPFIDLPNFTSDRPLAAIFGGFFLGAGIALSIRGGGVLDGTEILAMLISKRYPATVGDAILFFNIIIFSTALLILFPEQVLFSILTYFSACKTVDFFMNGIESFNGVLIISNKSEKIRFAIVNDLGRGITLLKGKGGYSEKDQELLFCVLTRLEIGKMKRIVEDLDKSAFLIVFPISDVKGGTVKKFLHEKSILEEKNQNDVEFGKKGINESGNPIF